MPQKQHFRQQDTHSEPVVFPNRERLTEEETRAVIALWMEKQNTGLPEITDAPTMADMAESLGVSAGEASRLLDEARARRALEQERRIALQQQAEAAAGTAEAEARRLEADARRAEAEARIRRAQSAPANVYTRAVPDNSPRVSGWLAFLIASLMALSMPLLWLLLYGP